MKWILLLLSIVGIAASALALREHYRTDTSPCSINERWDCGIVNHSPYAVIGGIVRRSFDPPSHSPLAAIPVAAVGIAGYLFLGILAFKRAYRLVLLASLVGLGFSLYLARIEAKVLGVWCIYCVISLAVISLISVLDLGQVVVQSLSRSKAST